MATRPSIAVIYLARKAEGLACFEQFLASYDSRPAGVEHELVVIYKGFENDAATLEQARALFSGTAHRALFVSDRHFDVGAYLIAAHQVETHFVCFLNTHTTIRAPHWLAHLAAAIARPDIGLAGATASFESLYDSNAIISKAVWLTGKIPYHRELADHYGFALGIHAPAWLASASSEQAADVDIAELCRGLEDEWRQYWGWCISIVGPLHYIENFPRFPNAHIRSNGFIVERKWLTEHFPSVRPTKYAAYGFESGFNGLSKAVGERGEQLAIVDRQGNIFLPDRWQESRTFRLGDQDGLIVADNQTRAFDAMPARERDLHTMMSWGRELVQRKSVPNLGLPFSQGRGPDFQELRKTARDTAPRKIYRYFLEAIRNLR